MNKKIAVILSGCGQLDGTDINEAVLTMLALEQYGLHYDLFAPDRDFDCIVNHTEGSHSQERRNVLIESARMARGVIYNMSEIKADTYAALIVPGGVGVTTILSDFRFSGHHFTVLPELTRLCENFYRCSKPMAFMGNASMIPARIFGDGVRLTTGSDAKIIYTLNWLGASYVQVNADEIIYDSHFNTLTLPACMLAENLSELNVGINKLIDKISMLI